MKFTPLLLALLLFSCESSSEGINLENIKPGNVQFFETYSSSELNAAWMVVCKWNEDQDSLVSQGKVPMSMLETRVLSGMVHPAGENAFGYVKKSDIDRVDSILSLPEVKKHFPKDLQFMWSFGPEEARMTGLEGMYALYAVKVPEGNKAPIDSKYITTAEATIDERTNSPIINITMNDQGSHDWELLTRKNIGRCIAITIDHKVLSCPRVVSEIAGGETQISGSFTIAQSQELAARINAGK